MANVTIREISTEATTVNNDDLVEIDQGSESKKLSFSTIISWIKSVFESGNDLIVGDWVNGGYVGDVVPVIGNVQEPSADRPRLCLTDFTGSKVVSTTNWPDITKPSGGTIDGLVSHLRAQQLIYLEGIAGETSTFAGTAAGSVITLLNTTANNDLLAALVEFQADFGTYTNWLTLDWNGTTYAINGLNATTRKITVTGTPTAGAGDVTIYPHRIAGSTTTARVHSAVGKDLRAAGTTEYLAGLMWRDQMQLIVGEISNSRLWSGASVNASGALSQGLASPKEYAEGISLNASNQAIKFNSADSTVAGGARTGTTTRGAGMGVHYYLHGGRYSS